MKTLKVENVNDSVGYISNALKKIHASDDHGLDQAEVQRLLKIEKEFKDSFKPLQKQFKIFNSTIENSFRAIIETLRIVAEPTFRALFRASEYGWYLSPEAVRNYSISQLAELLQQRDLTELERTLLMDATNLAKRIIHKAIQNFPHRKQILSEIQDCFNKELYSAAVSLSYSQTDGICNEIWGFGFFDKTKKPDFKLKTHVEFKNYNDGLATIISEQLTTKDNEVTMHSDSFKKKYPDKIQSSFNRHLVLHGHSVDHGNKTNALRAMLLIDFLMYFKDVKEKNGL